MGAGQSMTHGEGLNNPGNIIRDKKPCPGLAPRAEQCLDEGSADHRFCEFDTPLQGICALCRVLLAHQRRNGCRTLAQMIRRWAPGSEADIEAYVAAAEKRSGIARAGPVDLDHPGELAGVARAIIYHENGRCIYDAGLIIQAAAMALAP